MQVSLEMYRKGMFFLCSFGLGLLAYGLKCTWILHLAQKSFCLVPAFTQASIFLPPFFHIHTCLASLQLFSLSISVSLFHVPFHIHSPEKWPLCIRSDQVARECLWKWPIKQRAESKHLWMINTCTEQEPQSWLNLNMLWWVKSLYFCNRSNDGSRLFTMSWLFL